MLVRCTLGVGMFQKRICQFFEVVFVARQVRQVPKQIAFNADFLPVSDFLGVFARRFAHHLPADGDGRLGQIAEGVVGRFNIVFAIVVGDVAHVAARRVAGEREQIDVAGAAVDRIADLNLHAGLRTFRQLERREPRTGVAADEGDFVLGVQRSVARFRRGDLAVSVQVIAVATLIDLKRNRREVVALHRKKPEMSEALSAESRDRPAQNHHGVQRAFERLGTADRAERGRADQKRHGDQLQQVTPPARPPRLLAAPQRIIEQTERPLGGFVGHPPEPMNDRIQKSAK